MSSYTHPFEIRTEETLRMLSDTGQYKTLQVLESPMDATVRIRHSDGSARQVLCFCSNNYLGLANEPRVVEAGIAALRKYGAGTASVRFICGTFEPHEHLERTIAEYMGTSSSYSFVSCWTATEALFPTFCEAGDIIISDELNHACIIDAIRLTPIIKKGVKKTVYKHSDMQSLRDRLREAASDPEVTGQIWVVTDGVFSMEGDIANLPAMRHLCDEFSALLVVDDSHGHGVMGRTGRGTHEHYGLIGRNDIGNVDVFTGTLGKALGGAAGGFVAGTSEMTDLLIQRARPTLFSNALPVTVAASAAKAIEIVMDEPERVTRLKNNVETAREKIARAGFEVISSPTAICPIIVGETAQAIRMSKRLLELGVFVIGFGYPVVPEGTARLRIQLSAAHTDEHISTLVDALKKL
ncbi:MAG: aminotransferase class I/II-fold pyridoxal phosphate-dependent enzyme [Phycisphaeraceae bacterium]|nr:aminotransferase class I/II-fold pyridoxal phosphate-dependent enzyme [Phycisphaeraceae bacterium]MCW5761771.1 aminotransferase class I/II-fold pyridoxal phosphate-dependent enzyme [Phycisphaeraceae bacterium]